MRFLYRFAPALLLAGCSAVGPDYERPSAPLPTAWDDYGLEWSARTSKDNADKGTPESVDEWWAHYQDPELSRLLALIDTQNLTLLAAQERVKQGVQALRGARASFFPALNASAVYNRYEASDARTRFPGAYETFYEALLALNYELDFWGRLRRQSEGAQADLALLERSFAASRLSLQELVASTYFSLRAVEQEIKVLRRTVATRRRNANLVSERLKEGSANQLDASRALGELHDVKADIEGLAATRQTLINTLAELTGQPASGFKVEAKPLKNTPPLPPRQLPSALLERRPDIAAAESAMVRANADIGVATAAFYPTFSILADGGWSASSIDDLMMAPARVFSVGPGMTLPVFLGGQNQANLSAAEHRYLETVALYRAAVLEAVRETQDALAQVKYLSRQLKELDKTVKHYATAASLSNDRFFEGLVSYLEVVDAQRRMLDFERERAQVRGALFRASVALTSAVGGGFDQRLLAENTFSLEEQF